MWSFAISQHGLALSYEDLRAMTPRAYSALKRRWREHRDFHLTIHASLQATLHNAWLRGEGAPAFKPDDFMPGKKGQSVEDNIAMLAAAMEAATAQMGQRPRHEVQVDDDGRRRWEELRQQALARKAAASGG